MDRQARSAPGYPRHPVRNPGRIAIMADAATFDAPRPPATSAAFECLDPVGGGLGGVSAGEVLDHRTVVAKSDRRLPLLLEVLAESEFATGLRLGAIHGLGSLRI